MLLPDFAENRLKLAEILYYKILENVLVQENKRLNGKDMSVSTLSSTHALTDLSSREPEGTS